MLSELQRRKFEHLFTLLDVDDDGTIDRMDYTASADRLVSAFGYATDSLECRQLRDRYNTLWETVTLPMDTDGDERVDVEEYSTGMERFVTSAEGGYQDHIAPVADAFYDLMDVDQDGLITRMEYVRMMSSAFRLSEEASLTAFDHLDLDGNGVLSRDELHLANEQFFRGDDAEAKGNWIFGPLPLLV
ncbi:Ca2+-binding protein, EF-hand superfamily [Lentzea fradiae]|uniref:Ca2+-binding protein, EF-hand superfamily n=1 Tax=Lentzea fradiae TaxID=200378 RepID=A0A1G8ANM1_9PSEU|nr:EF-hand domain-containing protein [Lentzea fradiae]SDH22662.1 Ca2+-binding protein, EF-hand superfamily [Lentzea fradiae]